MVDISIVTNNLKKNQSLLDTLIGNMDEINADVLERMGWNIVYKARHNLQQNGNIDSGELLADVRILEKTFEFVKVGTTKPQGYIIEFGRGEIIAKDGKTLRWIDKDTGEVVYAKRSGPVDAMPWLEPAVIEETKHLQGLYKEKVEDTARRVL